MPDNQIFLPIGMTDAEAINDILNYLYETEDPSLSEAQLAKLASLDDESVQMFCEICEKYNLVDLADKTLYDIITAKGESESLADIDKYAGDADASSMDPVRQYFIDIHYNSFLTAEQEAECGKRITEGKFAESALVDIRKCNSDVSEEEIEELEHLIKRGEDARALLIRSNLRLVVSIARKYLFWDIGVMHFLDLVQEGNIGLMKAVDLFDYTKGFRFTTYATPWIKQKISRAISNMRRTIRLPVHLSQKVQKIKQVREKLFLEIGEEPTIAQIAAATDLPEEKVLQYLEVSKSISSLQEPVGDSDGRQTELGELLANDVEDQIEYSPEEKAMRTFMRMDIDNVMETYLSAREQNVIKKRFGLIDGRIWTLEEIGNELHVTRERVRQIEKKALDKLRKPGASRKLRDYI